MGGFAFHCYWNPKEEWPDLDRYGSKRRLPLTVKLNDTTTGVTCAERVGVLTFRVSDALLQELAGQAQSPLSTERYEKDLANALMWNRTHDLHLCAIMDPVGKPKKTSIGRAKKPTTRHTEDAALNKLYNATIETDHFHDAINAIDELVDSREDLEILRAKLLALDGIESPAGEGDHRSLWDLAEDLAGALYDALATLGKTEDILDKIAACAPNLEEAEERK